MRVPGRFVLWATSAHFGRRSVGISERGKHAALKRGKPVVFPTDTVYGVGVAVGAAESPQVLYDLKRREDKKPIAWLVGEVDDLARYGRAVPELAFALARTFWPGPLTLVVKASAAVPPAFRSAEGTIGLRMPANETALALVRSRSTPRWRRL